MLLLEKVCNDKFMNYTYVYFSPKSLGIIQSKFIYIALKYYVAILARFIN